MNWQGWGQVVLTVTAPAGLAYLSAKAAIRRSQRARDRRADGEAYDRAQRINRDIVADLEHQLERLEKRADAAEARAEAAERRAEAAEERARQLSVQVAGLRRTVQQMAREMQSRGLQPPAEATEEP